MSNEINFEFITFKVTRGSFDRHIFYSLDD